MRIIKTITLLALLLVLAGCTMSPEQEKPAINNDVDGDGALMSQVNVTIGGNARTILPELSNGFSKIILSAEPASGNSYSAPTPMKVDYGNNWNIGLYYGDWLLTATAYIRVDGVDYPAVKGSAFLTVDSSNHWLTIYINAPESGGTGTFNYTVRYPVGGTASVTLAPLGGGTPIINNVTVSSGSPGSTPIDSGIYFLTVTATKGKPVTRNEVVHIYPYSPTNADYVFTKLDFGNDDLRLGGTIKILVNGEQPTKAYLFIATDNNEWSIPITFTGSDGTGTWYRSFSSLNAANTLYINAGISYQVYEALPSIAIPVDDDTGIDLGTVDIAFNPIILADDTWVDGNITTSYVTDWYSINVTAGKAYHIWWNDSYQGDGSKSLDVRVRAYDSDWNYIFDADSAWDGPCVYTATANGTMYLKVEGWNQANTGTYAIKHNIHTPKSSVNAEITRTAFDTNDNLRLEYASWAYKGEEVFARIYDYMYYSHSPDLTYTWFIDGVERPVSTDTYFDGWNYRHGQTYLPTSGLSAGNHYGLAVITIDEAAFAKEFTFWVYE